MKFLKTSIIIASLIIASSAVMAAQTSGSSSLSVSGSDVQANPNMVGSNVSDNGQFIGPVSPAPSLGLVNGGIYGFAPTLGFNSGFSTNANWQPKIGDEPAWGVTLLGYNLSYGFGNGIALLTSGNLFNWSSQFGPGQDFNFNNSMQYGIQYTTANNYQFAFNLNINRWSKYNNGKNAVNFNYDFQPLVQKVYGQNAFALQFDLVDCVTPQPLITGQSSGMYWKINPQYSYLWTSNLTYSTQATVRFATIANHGVSDQTGNSNGDLLELQYLNLNYNLPQISGVNLSLTSKADWNNFRGPNTANPGSTGTGYYYSMEFDPKISYNGSITSTIGYWISDGVAVSHNFTPIRYVTGEGDWNFNQTQVSNNISFGFNDTFNCVTLSDSVKADNIKNGQDFSHDDNGADQNISASINDSTLIQNIASLLHI